jgi:hypothetical protein
MAEIGPPAFGESGWQCLMALVGTAILKISGQQRRWVRSERSVQKFKLQTLAKPWALITYHFRFPPLLHTIWR